MKNSFFKLTLLLLVGCILSLCSFSQKNKWEVQAGARIAFPISDGFNDTHSFGLGFDGRVAYEITPTFSLGGSATFKHFFGKEIHTTLGDARYEGVNWFSINGSGRFVGNGGFTLGADVGLGIFGYGNHYATGLNFEVSSGFSWDSHYHKNGILGFVETYTKNGSTDAVLGVRYYYTFD